MLHYFVKVRDNCVKQKCLILRRYEHRLQQAYKILFKGISRRAKYCQKSLPDIVVLHYRDTTST